MMAEHQLQQPTESRYTDAESAAASIQYQVTVKYLFKTLKMSPIMTLRADRGLDAALGQCKASIRALSTS